MSEKVIWVPIKEPLVTIKQNGWKQITEVEQSISFEAKQLESGKTGFKAS